MNCEEVSELLPAYVLGALEADEAALVEEHLRAGNEHEQELVELRATVFALDRHAGDLAFDPAAEVAAKSLESRRRIAAQSRPSAWWAAVAAAVLVAVFGAGWVVGGLVGDDPEAVSIQVQGIEGRNLVFEAGGDSDSVTVTMSGFDQLPEGQAYQLWAIRDEQWQRIGVCNTNDRGWWRGDFVFEIKPGERVAVTIEPIEGSPTPSSAPILISDF